MLQRELPINLEDEELNLKPGSVLLDDKGFIHYSAGSWSPVDYAHCLPTFIAYAPSDKVNIRQAKSLRTSIGEYTKVYNQDIGTYRLLQEAYGYKNDNRFGKVSFIDPCDFNSVIPPIGLEKLYNLAPQEATEVETLVQFLELNQYLNHLFIGGSLLLNHNNKARYDIDILFEGYELCLEVQSKVAYHTKRGDFLKTKGTFFQTFSFNGVVFDLQYSRAVFDVDPFIDFDLQQLPSRKGEVEFKITSAEDSIFFPVMYQTDKGLLISFKAGHRGLFSIEDTLCFNECLTRATFTWEGGCEDIFLVGNNQYAEVI
jgi:hypothetical protein